MDHPIQQKKGLRRAFTRRALPYWAAAIVAHIVLYLIVRPHSSTQRVGGDTLTVSQVLRANFDRQEQHYGARLRKVYPDVRDGKFKADFLFGDTLPDNIRAGQTYYLNLQLGQSEEAVLIPRGSFYQHTAANGYTSSPNTTAPRSAPSPSAARTRSTTKSSTASAPARKSSPAATTTTATTTC